MTRSIYVVLFFTLTQNFNISYAQFFNQPESITYDDGNNRYLISNRGSGVIAHMSDTDTGLTNFEGNLGLTIRDSTLFAVLDSGVIKGYHLTTEEEIFSVTIPEAQLLNDLAFDTSGFLYVTDYNGNKIYRVNIEAKHYSVFVSSGITFPNGILYDEENNRLIFCESYSGRIKEVNLEDSSVSTIIQNTYLGMDGMSVDNEGNIYVSNWQNHSVYKFDKGFTMPPTLVSSGFNGPADIFYNKKTNTLAVPSYNQNSVKFIQTPVTNADDGAQQTPLTYRLHQNFPNPFNPTTTIQFQVPTSANVAIEIFDILGRRHAALLNQEFSTGAHSFNWDASNVPGGVYFCRMTSGSGAKTIKMVLQK